MVIQGSVYNLLRGFEDVKNLDSIKKSLIGQPMTDSDGNIMGHISRVCVEDNHWYLYISDCIFENNVPVSFEISG